jgi:ubiquinone/menaquinone biosynthesis C-methylase UbiE
MNRKIIGILALIIVCSFLFNPISSWAQAKKQLTEWNEERLNQRQPPEKIMDAIGLKPGMTIADIGAGRGRFAVWFADRVGSKGRVYANDIARSALKYLESRCRRLGFNQVQTILGEVADPKLPPKTMDIAFVIASYHHFEKPVPLMKNIAPALKQDGVLVIVESEPKKAPDMGWHATDKDTLIAQLDRAGFELMKIETFLEIDNIYFFKVKSTSAD